MIKKVYKFIIIEEIGTSESGKTKIFSVMMKNRDVTFAELGQISYKFSWRKYAFFPHEDTCFEEICLQNITDFLKELNGQKLEMLI